MFLAVDDRSYILSVVSLIKDLSTKVQTYAASSFKTTQSGVANASINMAINGIQI
jgi:hypothetical protein